MEYPAFWELNLYTWHPVVIYEHQKGSTGWSITNTLYQTAGSCDYASLT